MEENERAQDMRTGQDKKEFMPNFLKDLNTEILEQLTKGSSEKNVVGLAGRKGAESGRGCMRATV